MSLGFFAIVACNGIDDVALVFLTTNTFSAGDAAAGLLLAGPGVGLLVGYLLLGRAKRFSLAPLLLGFAVSSAGNLLTGFTWAEYAALAVQTVRGLGIAAMDVASKTLLQRNVAPELLGRVFGTWTMALLPHRTGSHARVGIRGPYSSSYPGYRALSHFTARCTCSTDRPAAAASSSSDNLSRSRRC